MNCDRPYRSRHFQSDHMCDDLEGGKAFNRQQPAILLASTLGAYVHRNVPGHFGFSFRLKLGT